MTANSRPQFDKCFRQLEKLGLLLVSDSTFPNVYAIIAGEGRKGSWWSNDQAHTIFAVNEMLEDHPDVMLLKLIAGKVTFVHRELWGQIYSIGVAREEWQMKKLSPEAKSLLEGLDSAGTLQVSKLGKAFGPKPAETAKELEQRMLVQAAQVHTESGAHSKILKTWDTWAKDLGFRVRAQSASTAQKFIEKRVEQITRDYGRAKARLPWQT